MYTPIIGSTAFLRLLARFDEDLAEALRPRGCAHCGAAIDRADFPRKPRGGPRNLPEECKKRRSFCCRREGCRARRSPPSVLFLDRRVYLASVVVLISTLAHGATPRRLQALRTRIGASPPTIARWRRWWREAFPSSEVGQLVRARLVGSLDLERLPRSLLESISGPLVGRVVAVLRVLAGMHAL